MHYYIARRVLLMIPTLLGMTAVVFFVIALSPGGMGASLINAEIGLRPQERKVVEAYFRARYGLDEHPIIQYFHWLNHVSPIGVKDKGEGFPGPWKFGFKAPDLGESWSTHRPVSALIGESVPITVLLELISLPLVYGISIWSGIRAARSRGELIDQGLSFSLIGLYSLPSIWVGVLMIGFLSNEKYLHLFPSNGLHDLRADSMPFLPYWDHGFHSGWMLDMAWHMCLPVICLTYGTFAFLSRLQRGALLEALGQDYVRTARAKGLREHLVIYRHAFRNSLMPMITVAANILPGLIGGSVIVETIFGIQGMGKLSIDAINAKDSELLMALTLFAGILQLIGNLITDISYALADPRVSYAD